MDMDGSRYEEDETVVVGEEDTCEVGIADFLTRVIKTVAVRPLPDTMTVERKRPRAGRILLHQNLGADVLRDCVAPLREAEAIVAEVKRVHNPVIRDAREKKRQTQAQVLGYIPPAVGSGQLLTADNSQMVTITTERQEISKKITAKLLRELAVPVVRQYLEEVAPDMVGAPFNRTAIEALGDRDLCALGDRLAEHMARAYERGELRDEKVKITVKFADI